MNAEAIKQLQTSLGLPATGVFDASTMNAMNSAVTKAVSSNKDVQRFAGANGADAVLNAYMTGNWSGVVDLTGKPFTREQQQKAVSEAEKVLAPAYKEGESYDRSVTEDTLRAEQEGFKEFQKTEERDFGDMKDSQDQASADQGILFTGSRAEKLNDLRNTFEDRQRIARQQSTERTRQTMRNYQYDYGGDAAKGLRDMYKLPGASGYDANVAGGMVRRSPTLSAVYDPKEFDFQGRKPVAQKAAVQTRAASQLANTANKLTLGGYANKF